MAKCKYNADTFPLLAEGYARDGLTDEQIAAKLGISPACFYRYQKKHCEFLEAIKRGKAPVDVDVENALLKRAQGYTFNEVHIEDVIDKKTGKSLGICKRKTVLKEVSPDITAQIFWLKNRMPHKWRDKQEVDVKGDLKGQITLQIGSDERDI